MKKIILILTLMMIMLTACTDADIASTNLSIGEDAYKKHFLGLSDNVTYFAEQIETAKVSAYHYRVTFKPQTLLPDIDFKKGE